MCLSSCTSRKLFGGMCTVMQIIISDLKTKAAPNGSLHMLAINIPEYLMPTRKFVVST